MQELLRIDNLSKTFTGQRALSEVGIDLRPGEVHALVGQNGSGKSTLIKILAGYHQPDAGATAMVDGVPLTLGDGQAALAAGVRFVHQDLGLVDTLSAVENLALTAGYSTGFGRHIHWRSERKKAKAALLDLGVDIDVDAPIATLPPSQRTAIAIARATDNWEAGAKLLVLDEPTATLPDDDVQRLFEVVRKLKERNLAILYVSHHLDEVFELADRVTVFRDGKRVACEDVKAIDHDRLIELMIGRRLEHVSATDSNTAGDIALRVRDLFGGTVHGVDFDVHAGEIVGIAGITGSGRENLLGLIAGQSPSESGEVSVGGALLKNYSPRAAIDAGVAFVPAERAVRGTVGTMTVRENLSLADVARHKRAGRLRHDNERTETTDWIHRLSIKTSGSEALITSLSGGNQQKVMFGKALRLNPKVLLLDEPTQGIDVGAKDQIHRLIDEAAQSGVATLVASTDTDELVRLCHRVIVLVDGRISSVFKGHEITADTIAYTQLQSSRRAS